VVVAVVTRILRSYYATEPGLALVKDRRQLQQRGNKTTFRDEDKSGNPIISISVASSASALKASTRFYTGQHCGAAPSRLLKKSFSS
jgi:hypothetical protein